MAQSHSLLMLICQQTNTCVLSGTKTFNYDEYSPTCRSLSFNSFLSCHPWEHPERWISDKRLHFCLF